MINVTFVRAISGSPRNYAVISWGITGGFLDYARNDRLIKCHVELVETSPSLSKIPLLCVRQYQALTREFMPYTQFKKRECWRCGASAKLRSDFMCFKRATLALFELGLQRANRPCLGEGRVALRRATKSLDGVWGRAPHILNKCAQKQNRPAWVFFVFALVKFANRSREIKCGYCGLLQT